MSPFETDLDDFDRDYTARNLDRLELEPERAGPLRFAVLSDTHSSYDELGRIVDLINARDDISFVLVLGDLTDSGLRREFLWALEQLRRLDVPFLTTIGNHDALSNGPEIYGAMFGDFNYSFTYRRVRLVMITTIARELPDAVPSEAWLAEATRPSAGADTVIVAAHELPRDPALEVVAAQNGVGALITGHIHGVGKYTAHGVPGFRVGAVVRDFWAIVTMGETLSAESCVGSECTEGAL